MRDKFFIGFEVGTGKEIYVPPAHMVITGITRAGKTTCIESVVHDSGMTAVLFKTKVGEKAITTGHKIPPFFREKHDWVYVQSLLEATLKEKLKFERAWIIEVCKRTHSLGDVKVNIDAKLEDKKVRGISRNVYLTLQAYFDMILPQLRGTEFTNELTLSEGINIMDLEDFSGEIQSLVIRSVLEEVLYSRTATLVVAPEFWKFCPQHRGNPVKPMAEEFIRQSATNDNFLVIDSQDMAGIDKTILKQVSTWVLGNQREINEVKHTLAQIPLPTKAKPKPEDIQTLKTGHFYVCTSDFTTKVYVKPTWMDAKTAKGVALGDNPTPIPGAIQEGGELTNNNPPQSPNTSPNTPVNMDLIVDAVLLKIGPKLQAIKEEILHQEDSYVVAPLEKIKKDFLQETKEWILRDVSSTTENQRKILRFFESSGKGSNITQILDRVFGMSTTSKGNRERVLDNCKTLKFLNLIRMDSNNRMYPYLRDRISDRLLFFDATEEEINLIYDHILTTIINEDG